VEKTDKIHHLEYVALKNRQGHCQRLWELKKERETRIANYREVWELIKMNWNQQ
jgi:hypothetical protein